jgi:hypothetical protein
LLLLLASSFRVVEAVDDLGRTYSMKNSRTLALCVAVMGLVGGCALELDDADPEETIDSADPAALMMETATDTHYDGGDVFVSTSGTNCLGTSHFFNTCIHVWGSGLHVDYVQGSTSLTNPNATCSGPGSYTGHFETWGPILSNGTRSFHKNSAEKTYGCNTNQHSTRKYSIDMNLPDSSWVCTRFWWKIGGDYNDTGTECLQIHK